MTSPLVTQFEKAQITKPKHEFAIGDTVNVHVKIEEGEKVRTQLFNGTVISRKGSGMNEVVTVRRITNTNNEGIERIFPLQSPNVLKIEVIRSGMTRRAKLYFLRDRVGKAVRLREKRR
ncbi:MAG: 50S ribosomal protein L19 [Sedimentisphaerales bacterium]|nr:50S ribosomal protein L19 [Sedimentisphaerales bacterium]